MATLYTKFRYERADGGQGICRQTIQLEENTLEQATDTDCKRLLQLMGEILLQENGLRRILGSEFISAQEYEQSMAVHGMLRTHPKEGYDWKGYLKLTVEDEDGRADLPVEVYLRRNPETFSPQQRRLLVHWVEADIRYLNALPDLQKIEWSNETEYQALQEEIGL